METIIHIRKLLEELETTIPEAKKEILDAIGGDLLWLSGYIRGLEK